DGNAGPERCALFAFELVRRFSGRAEEKAVDALEVAIDPFPLHDALDEVDGRRVTLGGQSGAVTSAETLDGVVPSIEGVRQVGSRAPRLTTRDRAVVDHEHAAAGP